MIKTLILFLERFVAAPDLALRLWMAWIFFKSGLTKVTGFPPEITATTKWLFENEYKVGFMSPEVAAYMGSYGELILPIFLIIGLGGRWAAGGLFGVNLIAVISYPALFPKEMQDNGMFDFLIHFMTSMGSTPGLIQHQLWALVLLYLFLRGPGKLSFDHIIRMKFMPNQLPNP